MSETEAATSGSALRSARQRRGLDVATASRDTALPMRVLQVLESSDAAALRADVRLQAQLRVYARYLGLDPEPLLRELAAGDTGEPAGGPGPARRPMGPSPAAAPRGTARSRRVPAVLGWLAVGALVGAVVAFIVLSLGGFGSASEPDVRLTSPAATGDGDTDDDDTDDGDPDDDDTGVADDLDADRADDRNASRWDETEAVEEPTAPAGEAPTTNTGEEPAGDTDDGQDADVPGRAPADTRVQLLNGSRDAERVAAAREALAALGYDIVNDGPETTAEAWQATGVYHTPGWEQEAQGLATRDERFTHRGANPGFSAEADLHVVVGRDWPQP